VCPIRWSSFAARSSAGVLPPFFADMLNRGRRRSEAPRSRGEVAERAGRGAVGPDQRSLTEYVRSQVLQVLGFTDASRIDSEIPLLDLGFDSLMAVQLRNLIRKDLKVDLPLGSLFESTSIEDLAGLLQERTAVARLLPADAGQGQAPLIDYVQDCVRRILGFADRSQVERDVPILELGFDSLMAVQLRNAIRKELKVDLPLGDLFESASIEDITGLLEEQMTASSMLPRASGRGPVAEVVEVV
jgi:acyl carrier protein